MKRMAGRLTALAVRRAKPGMHHDGHGLYLAVGDNGASWVLRFTLHGRAREMGLGSASVFGLAEARAKAIDAKKLLHDGHDPIEVRKATRAQAQLDAARSITFKRVAEEYIQSHEAGWSAVHRRQWRNTLAQHVYPVLGGLPIGAIDTALVMRAIKPLWRSAPETASRVRGRIERVLDAAKAQELRTGENPARWRGHLDTLLPPRSKVLAVRHHPAMDYNKLPGFMVDLHKQEDIVSRLVEFIILTATRLGEATGARWEEFDLDRAVWTIPAARMKSGKEHRVPLSRRVIGLLQGLPRTGELVFPHPRRTNSTIHHNDPTRLLRRLGSSEAIHGFRSTFRDWASETTAYPNHVVEQALAHTIASSVEAAYRRGDLLAKRARLMEAWSEFCGSPPIERSEVVVQLGRQ
jgi:integrase